MSLSCTVSEIVRYWSKIANLNLPTIICAVTILEFRRFSASENYESLRYRTALFLRGLAVLVEHRLLTDRRTDGHITTASTVVTTMRYTNRRLLYFTLLYRASIATRW